MLRRLVDGMVAGMAAGAAGTTALNAVAYADMALRGRGASSTPERTVETIAERVGLRVPGRGDTRENRLAALGALTGIAAGVGMGAVFGGLWALGLRPPLAVGTPLVAAAAMAATDVPMARLGVSDPRTWSAGAWLSDVVPHLAYGAVTGATLEALDPGRA
jgi:hypothetical protein